MNTFSDYPDVKAYATCMSEPEPPLLAALREETVATVHGSHMLSTPWQGRLLAFLSRLVAPQKILEIGTYTGYSALCLAEGLRAGGELHTIDRHHYSLVDRYFAKADVASQIHYHIGRADDLLPTIDGPFDLIFLDADKKKYATYATYLLPQLRIGGVIIADNVLWKEKVLSVEGCREDPRAAAMRHLAMHWQKEPELLPLLLPVNDGLLVAQKCKRPASNNSE